VGAAVVAWVFLSGSYAHAQVGDDVIPLPSTSFTRPDALPIVDTARGGGQLVGWTALSTVVPQRTLVQGRAPSTAGRRRTTGNKTLAVAIVAATGFFVGGYLGAAIEGHSCACDDPGMLGAMVGAPIGAVAGAVLGVKLF
jgi:hypothetical protein